MPKLSLEFAVDFGSLTKELEKAESKSKEAFANIGDGAAVGAITSAFRDIAEQIEAMSGASEKFNKTWDAGLKTDEKRLSIAKEMLKTQQQMSDLEKHVRQAEESQGRRGGGGMGGGAGGIGGRRGGSMSRGLNRGAGIISGGFGLLNQASEGFTTTSDYLNFGGSVAGMAGKGAMGAAVLGMGSKLLGPIGLALHGVAEGLKYAGKLSDVQERHEARAVSAYAGAGTSGYNAYMHAQAYEYGTARKDATSGGGYGFRKYGIAPDTATGFIAGMGRASAGAAGSDVNMRHLSALHRMYGASTEGIGLMGTAQRSGSFAAGVGGGSRSQKQSELFAKAMGVALATEMDHGRIGESFEQIGNVSSLLAKRGDVNLDVVMGMVTAIGRMGDRYQGTGPGADQAVGVLGGLAHSKTAYGRGMTYLRLQQQNPKLNAFGIQAKMGMQGAEDFMQVARDVKGEAATLMAGGGLEREDITGELARRYGIGDANMRAFHDVLWKMVMDDAKLVDKVQGREALTAKPPPGMGVFRKQGGAAATKWGDWAASDPDLLQGSGYESASKETRRKADAAKWGRETFEPWMNRVFPGGGGEGAATGPVVTPLSGAGSQSFRSQNESYRSSATRAGTVHGGLRYNRRDKTTGKYRDLLPGEKPRGHSGEDVYPPDTKHNTIFAPHDGVIGPVYSEPRAGMTVVIIRGDGRKTIMRHLKGVLVKKQQSVKQGQKIAKGLFKFESSTKSHVHAEAYDKQGKKVDPVDQFSYDDIYGGQLGIGKPEDMDPAAEPGADAGASTGGDLGSDPTGLGVSATVSPAASGGVSVALTITDRTSAGVSVAEASRSHTSKAMQPAPGDIPALYNREGA